MGASVGILSELQLSFPYLSCPGNHSVACSDSDIREFSDWGQGNRATPYDGKLGRERERGSITAADCNAFSPLVLSVCFQIWNKSPEFSFLFLLPGRMNLFPVSSPGSWSPHSFWGPVKYLDLEMLLLPSTATNCTW